MAQTGRTHVEIKGDASHLITALNEQTAAIRKLRDEMDEQNRVWASFWADRLVRCADLLVLGHLPQR